MKIVEAPQYGPMFRFTDASVYWALYVLSDGKRVGRKRLSEMIGVGEGSMRRILNTLKERNMVLIKQTGITITKAGLDFLEQTPIRVIDLNPGSLVIGVIRQLQPPTATLARRNTPRPSVPTTWHWQSDRTKLIQSRKSLRLRIL